MTESLDSRRLELVGAAQKQWIAALTDLGGRNTLLYYKDRRAGTLDLAHADAAAMDRFTRTGSIRLTRLFSDVDLRADAIRRMQAIHRKARELLEERGIRAGYLALGLARWDELFLEPAAPVLLRGLTITPTRARYDDFELVLDDEPSAEDLHSALDAAARQLAEWQRLSVGEAEAAVPRVSAGYAAVARLYAEAERQLAALRAFVLSVPASPVEPAVHALAADQQTPWKLSRLYQLAKRFDRMGLRPLLDELARKQASGDLAAATFDHAWYSSILDQIRVRDPRYAAERGTALDEIADDFRRRDVEHLAANRSRVRRTWAEMTRDAEDRHPLQARVIRKQAALRRGHLPLRRLLDQAGDVLFAAKPCWAMSPLMVSQVLPAARLFDVVIFDEASQIVPADAIPSVIRAHQVVVAGDDHQLPPTNFFRQFSDLAAEDEDDEDTVSFGAGFESVLDALRPLLPIAPLNWHYRSRDERLVAFSNERIYGGTLTTFPGVLRDDCLQHVVVAQDASPGQDASVTAEADGAGTADAFAASVRSRLADYGITVVPQYGVGGYRVDFAAAHPDDPSRMILAVETDGASYRQAQVGAGQERRGLRRGQLAGPPERQDRPGPPGLVRLVRSQGRRPVRRARRAATVGSMTRALLVVDMQNGFCHPEGSFTRVGMGLESAEAAVRNAAVAVAQARRARIPVVFTRHLYRPGRADEGRALKQNNPGLAGVDGLKAGTWDADVVDELGCGPGDLVVDKVRFDAFQWTSLEPLLRGLGVDELVICGVVTNICVETTVRSAFMRDFPVTLLADCCAAATRRLHELSLEVLSSYQLAVIASITDGYDVGAAQGLTAAAR